MKRILIIVILLGVALAANAQQREFRDFYAAYAGREGFTSMELGEKMMKMMSKNSWKTDRELSELFDGIRAIRVVSSGTCDEAFVAGVRAVLENPRYKLMSSYSEGGQTTSFYFIDGGKFSDSEFLMVSTGTQECVVLDIYGEFDVKDISRLSKIRPKP